LHLNHVNLSLAIKNIEFFELELSDELVLMGSKLYEQKSINTGKEIDKNLWSFEVQGDQLYEVELFATGNRLKRSTCDCKKFLEDKECHHIVAALFSHREGQKSKKPKKQKSIAKRSRKRVILSEILNETSHDDLVYFLLNQASKDQKLSIALKSRFIHYFKSGTKINKYRLLLNEIIKPVTEKKGTVNGRSIKMFLTSGEELFLQFEDFISLGKYIEALDIIVALSEKTYYVLLHGNAYRSECIDFEIKLNTQINELTTADAAPEFRRTIFHQLTELISKSYFRIVQFDTSFIESLYHLSFDLGLVAQFEKVITEALNRRTHEGSTKVFLLSYIIRINVNNKEEIKLKILEDLEVDQVISVLGHLNKVKSNDVAEVFLDNYLEKVKDTRILSKRLLEMLFTNQNKEGFEAQFIRHFINYQDFELLDKANLDKKSFKNILKQVKLAFENDKVSHKNYINFCHRMNQYEIVLSLLEMKPNLEDLMTFDQELLNIYPGKMQTLYQKGITEALQEILGKSSVDLMKNLEQHFIKIDQLNFYQGLVNYISKEFSHRVALISEIK